MYRTKCINYYNAFCNQFDRNEHFSPFDFNSAGIMIGVWINSARLNNLLVRSRFGSWKVRRLKRAIDDDDDENGIMKKWTGFKKMLTVKAEKRKSTTTAKIGKRKEKEQIAISPSHRSRESLVTVMRARRLDLLRSPQPTPPWHI